MRQIMVSFRNLTNVMYDSLIYVNTPCANNATDMIFEVEFTNFTNDFEIGFMNENCRFDLNSNVDVILGSNNWCSSLDGMSLLNNYMIRFNNILHPQFRTNVDVEDRIVQFIFTYLHLFENLRQCY